MDASEKFNTILTLLKDCVSDDQLIVMARKEACQIQDTLFNATKQQTIKHMRALEVILDELYARWNQWEE